MIGLLKYFLGFLKSYFPKNTDFKFPQGINNKVGIGKFIESHKDGYCISKKLQKHHHLDFQKMLRKIEAA